MPTLPDAGANLVLNTADYERDISSAITQAGKLDAALNDLGGTVDLKVNIDDSEVSSTLLILDDLANDASVTVNVDDGELITAENTVQDIDDAAPNVTVNADGTELTNIQNTLEQIRTLSVINLVMEIPQSALDFVNKIPGIAAILERAGGENILEAALPGENIATEAQAVTDIYTEGFGESRAEVARFVAMLSNVGVEEQRLDDVANSLFETQTAIEGITGEAPGLEELLRLAQDLVGANIAGSFEEAADIMVAMEQSGIGVGQDALGDANEFVSVMGGMGFTSQQVLDTFNTGLAGGVDTISRMAEAIISFNENATQGTDDLKTSLDELDDVAGTSLTQMLTDFQAGEVTGADFMAAVLDGARTYAETEGESAAQTLLQGVFGSTTSNIGTAILDIDPNAGGFTDLEGRSQTAAESIRDDWQTTFEELQRTISEGVATTLDDTFDLTGRLETAKEQFQTFIEELQGGESIGDAIEIAFGIPGVDDALMNIERVFGNLVLAILEIVSSVQGILGKDNTATQNEIARLGANQLAFDLQVANPDEVTALIDQAISRGVDMTTIGNSLTTALDEMFASGDFGGGVDLLQGLFDAAVEQGNSTAGAEALMAQYAGQLQTAFDTAIAEGDFDIAKKIADSQGDPTAYTDAIKGVFGFDGAAFDSMISDSMAAMTTAIETETATPMEKWIADAEAWATQAETLATAQQQVEDAQSAMNAFGTDTETVTAAMETAAASNINGLIETIAAMSEAVTDADTSIANDLTGNTVTTSFEAVQLSADTHFPPVIRWLDETTQAVMRLDNAGKRLPALGGFLASLATGVTSFPYDKLQSIVNLAAGFADAGNTVNNTSTTVNVNQTNNVQNGAQANATTYQIANAVTG